MTIREILRLDGEIDGQRQSVLIDHNGYLVAWVRTPQQGDITEHVQYLAYDLDTNKCVSFADRDREPRHDG